MVFSKNMTHSFNVLLVEDSGTKSLKMRRYLEAQGFNVQVAYNGEAGLEIARSTHPDAIVSDILMPRMDGFQLCQEIRKDDQMRDTPIVLVTSTFDRPEDREFALYIGADAYVEDETVGEVELALTIRQAIFQRRGMLGAHLPWDPLPLEPSPTELDPSPTEFHQQHAERLRSLVTQKMDEVERSYSALSVAYDNVLEGLIGALDLRDTETELHSWRVAEYSLVLAIKADVGWTELMDIERGALLHDIGKIGISDAILRKPGPLDDQEWEEMRKHPQLGYDMIAGIDFLSGATEIVLSHHERWDGTGYPDGLLGEAIPLGSRIFAIADTIDAVTTDRPYRAGASIEIALGEIEANRGTQFDPALADLALEIEASAWTTIKESVEDRRRAKRAKRGKVPITLSTPSAELETRARLKRLQQLSTNKKRSRYSSTSAVRRHTS